MEGTKNEMRTKSAKNERVRKQYASYPFRFILSPCPRASVVFYHSAFRFISLFLLISFFLPAIPEALLSIPLKHLWQALCIPAKQDFA